MKTLLIATFLFAFPAVTAHTDVPPPLAAYELTERIIRCESGGRHIWSEVDFDPPSFGVAQYKKLTFDLLKKQCDKPHLLWKSKKDQIELTVCAVQLGKTKHWNSSKSCWNKV